MPRHYRSYTNQDIIEHSKTVHSIAALIKALGLIPAGGNYDSMKKKLQALQVDTSHWTGQAWSKNTQQKDWQNYNDVASLKPHLIQLRGHVCESCGQQSWLETAIPLELDHIDGDRTNNDLSNLRLLCCNCHALTPTWKGRNIALKAKAELAST